jgi:hypothetical protein
VSRPLLTALPRRRNDGPGGPLAPPGRPPRIAAAQAESITSSDTTSRSWIHDQAIEVERYDAYPGTKPKVGGVLFKIYQESGASSERNG